MDPKEIDGLCKEHNLPSQGIRYAKGEKSQFREYCSKCVEQISFGDLHKHLLSSPMINFKDLAIVLKGKVDYSTYAQEFYNSITNLIPQLTEEICRFYYMEFRRENIDYDTFPIPDFINSENYPLLHKFSKTNQTRIIQRVRDVIEVGCVNQAQELCAQNYENIVEEIQAELDDLIPDRYDDNKTWENLSTKLENIRNLHLTKLYKFPLIVHLDQARMTAVINDYRERIAEELTKQFLSNQKALIKKSIKNNITKALDARIGGLKNTLEDYGAQGSDEMIIVDKKIKTSVEFNDKEEIKIPLVGKIGRAHV